MSMSSHLRDSLLGWAAVMTSNSCLLANSFIAKHQPVTPGEILSSRLVSNKMALFSNKRLSSGSNHNYFRSFNKVTAQRSNKFFIRSKSNKFIINIVRSFYL